MKLLKCLTTLCIMGILNSGCHSQPVVTPPPPSEVPTLGARPAATNAPTTFASGTTTSIPVQIPLIVSPRSCAFSNGKLPSLSNPELTPIRRVNSTLGGGLVQSKEFSIELFLYCDSVFQPKAPPTDFQSDIGGLAVYHNWRYDASRGSGRIFGFFGIEPDIRWQSGEGPTTSQGHVAQGQSTGIHLAPDVAYDFSKLTSLRFIYLLQTESGQLSGAVLSFDVQQTPDGLQPNNVFATALSNSELESSKSTLPHVTP